MDTLSWRVEKPTPLFLSVAEHIIQESGASCQGGSHVWGGERQPIPVPVPGPFPAHPKIHPSTSGEGRLLFQKVHAAATLQILDKLPRHASEVIVKNAPFPLIIHIDNALYAHGGEIGIAIY